MTTLPPCGQTADDTSPLDHSEEGEGEKGEEGGRRRNRGGEKGEGKQRSVESGKEKKR